MILEIMQSYHTFQGGNAYKIAKHWEEHCTKKSLWLWIHTCIYLETYPDLSGFLSIRKIRLYPDQFPKNNIVSLMGNTITKSTKSYIVGHFFDQKFVQFLFYSEDFNLKKICPF